MDEEKLIDEIIKLRELLRAKEDQLAALRREKQIIQDYGLSNNEISRYSRQIFLPEIGIKGQLKLKNSAILIVGAGGLGCPAALYLASAGVGQIGIIDYDSIELNNLHRQLLYAETDIGIPKVDAAAEKLNRLNNNIKVTQYKVQLDSNNALEIIKCYDVVLDATDNVATRYLLNDACVLTKKPLVSASALRFEGHLSVFNYYGPCYRCIFPTPPPPETVTNCGDGGVFGPAVGTIGVLQALEALKILLNLPHVLSGQLLLFDGLETKFRNIKLRAKNVNCIICGEHPILQKLIDYEQFCGSKANDKDLKLNLLREEERISVEEYNRALKLRTEAHVLIDVRSPEEFEICNLRNSINIPLNEINNDENISLIKRKIQEILDKYDAANLYVMCRRGNDSQKAVRSLQKVFNRSNLTIKDVIGGIHAWSRRIDHTFPVY
ncbi:ubiquitin-like activating enzyme 4 isoform X1 [Osmia lignaria lignaria]|uniref:adenylyltransferase and sulfurtransferase MOCS3 n=1 Tax=Osmia bicornis bicornis TaxID=1437191 RepID=UPI0010F922CA|nr:adenylyltransferase and sulfurtransferase MOCS3 [Osmia bicornis bicornis]XP_029037928.1 adenylyltransferase and sulfurtransferase MOCS3 [Osmia bicornis bicornis]XP_029037929.1 adenylyltransferase and sulfurtransferase MOCS3 [Osmia bicornis bicornis]XP_029037930.1 adenylyltransferase and sulfurtransferase MOCS3 [Osmia bicornis bicornis]XP_029037931.1 adenylyltransferase and sulfurtransferase MOCS3 [Osmia bicornis bicornis]XP_029037932.1 adenylyltransferase and sulfurtransferase MOCS3 [Osmia 